MITYKIEPNHDGFLDRWKVVAVHGNDFERVVAQYPEKRKAQERISLMELIRKAEALTN